MKKFFNDIYYSIAVRIPYSNAWKASRRKMASDASQGSIVFGPTFTVN